MRPVSWLRVACSWPWDWITAWRSLVDLLHLGLGGVRLLLQVGLGGLLHHGGQAVLVDGVALVGGQAVDVLGSQQAVGCVR